jgi:glycosyltransferase involved in cell wall biosynthesis
VKVLHLVTWAQNGGATLGAYWLHRALRELGVDSTILTNSHTAIDDESVISLADSHVARLKMVASRRIAQIPLRVYRGRQNRIFNTGLDGLDFTRHPAYLAADLVHLHWVNGLVSTRALRKVTRPLVWTLRDMWPFTGGCHYSMECGRFIKGCGACPQLGSSRDNDLSRFVARHKQASVPEEIRIVGISRWLSDCASRSKIFRDCHVSTISNNVDTRLFSPVPRQEARQALGLDGDMRIVLIGAPNVTVFYKGFDLFLQAIDELRRGDVHVVTFGRSSSEHLDSMGVPNTSLGYLGSTEDLSVAYSAADVFVAPSRMDAFGKTIVEAMSCGTPVVCFDATGPKDIVQHRVTGYLAEPFSPQDLARGIRWVLDQCPEASATMSRRAQQRAEQRFDSRVIAQQYLELYREVMCSAKA